MCSLDFDCVIIHLFDMIRVANSWVLRLQHRRIVIEKWFRWQTGASRVRFDNYTWVIFIDINEGSVLTGQMLVKSGAEKTVSTMLEIRNGRWVCWLNWERGPISADVNYLNVNRVYCLAVLWLRHRVLMWARKYNTKWLFGCHHLNVIIT